MIQTKLGDTETRRAQAIEHRTAERRAYAINDALNAVLEVDYAPDEDSRNIIFEITDELERRLESEHCTMRAIELAIEAEDGNGQTE